MDDKFDINNNPEIRAATKAERERITRPKPAIVPLDEERNRRKRVGSGGGKKTGVGGNGPNWPDVTEHGAPKKTCANARMAIEILGVSCRYDEFHDRVTIESSTIEHLSGANLETAGHLLRIEMHKKFDFPRARIHSSAMSCGRCDGSSGKARRRRSCS
jgi:hypothetical protein